MLSMITNIQLKRDINKIFTIVEELIGSFKTR